MSFTIAITGKGGTGKTTITSLFINQMISQGIQPVLAVDADPNTCLDTVLGISAEKNIGTIREELKEYARENNTGLTKREILEYKISESLVEGSDFDFISMGRPEGPGCYCYANNLLKDILNAISASYPYVVIDNEAGLENLSRRIVQKVDLLVMVADPSKRGLETIIRLYHLAKEMEIAYEKTLIIVNKVRNTTLDTLKKQLEEVDPDYIVTLPVDNEILDFDEQGIPTKDLKNDNPAVSKIGTIVSQIFGGQQE